MTTTPRNHAGTRTAMKPRLVDASDGPPPLGLLDGRTRAGGAGLGAATQFAVKRLADIVGSIVLLVLLAPLFAMISLAVWITSPGPVIYRSARIGLGGTQFGCLKFRTMRKD